MKSELKTPWKQRRLLLKYFNEFTALYAVCSRSADSVWSSVCFSHFPLIYTPVIIQIRYLILFNYLITLLVEKKLAAWATPAPMSLVIKDPFFPQRPHFLTALILTPAS